MSVDLKQLINTELVYNKNEKLILKTLSRMLDENDGRLSLFTEKDFRDVFAHANNHLNPKYVQKGTIVVQDDVARDDVEDAVNNAIDVVLSNPKL